MTTKFQVYVNSNGKTIDQVFDTFNEAEDFKITAILLGATVIAGPTEVVQKKNLMSGLPYWEDKDTPLSCSPASETYWSM